MRGTFSGAGRTGVSAPGGWPHSCFDDSAAGLIDRVVDLALALGPLELKQHGQDASGPDGAAIEADGADVAVADAAGGAAESTTAMLARMRAVLDREAARLGEDGLEGKAAVDQVALIARTLEKIDQMERLIAADRARTDAATLDAAGREQLRQTVRQLILAAAERLVAERVGEGGETPKPPSVTPY